MQPTTPEERWHRVDWILSSLYQSGELRRAARGWSAASQLDDVQAPAGRVSDLAEYTRFGIDGKYLIICTRH